MRDINNNINILFNLRNFIFIACLDEPNAVDSTSSNSSITAEPACVQLLNHHHYHHLTKNSEDGNMQVHI